MREELEEVQKILNAYFERNPKPRVLDAGCGTWNPFHFPEGAHIVGIDILEEQLERNPYIHEKIKADIQTYDLGKNSYDIIICWNVLEHLPFPDFALFNFFKAIRKKGLIILGFPNINSFKGIVTKLAPSSLHTFVYHFVYGKKEKGRKEPAPFKTFHRSGISPQRLSKLAEENGYRVAFFKFYESYYQRKLREKNKLFRIAFDFLERFIKVASFGRIGLRNSECILILEG